MSSHNCAPIIQDEPVEYTKRGGMHPAASSKTKKIKYPAFKGTCFTKHDLIHIIREWNTLNPTNRIPLINNSIKEQWAALSARIASDDCKTEYCWVKRKLPHTLAKSLINNFRPEMPLVWHQKHTEWLSTIDIEKSLQQYEDEYANFAFKGAVPLDFDKELHPGVCVSNKVCRINLKTLKEHGKTKCGIVFNLDAHNKPGSHWIAMFIDIDRMTIGYWDSYGYKPPPEVRILLARLLAQSYRYFGGPMKIMYNDKRHQFKTSECGMYCIYFISQLLEGAPFLSVYNNIIKDDVMNQKRMYYFSKVQ